MGARLEHRTHILAILEHIRHENTSISEHILYQNIFYMRNRIMGKGMCFTMMMVKGTLY